MKRAVAIAVAGFVLLASELFGQSAILTLIRGKNHVINPGYTIGRTSIGDPSICDFVIPENRNEILLVPRGQGTTNLILYDVDGRKRDTYQIQVVPDLHRLATELAGVFTNITGLDIIIKNNRIVISGTVFSEKDFQFIQDNIDAVRDVVIADIRLDPEALQILAQEIENAIGREEISTRVLKDKILLEGVAYSEGQMQRADAIAQALAPNRVVNVLEVQEEGRYFRSDKLVHFDIKFIEINFQNMKDWGLDWGISIPTESSLEYESLPPDNQGEYTINAVLQNFLPNLNILVSEGAGKLLLNPRIICKNGETAREVVDGGEVPVIVVTNNNVSVTYKEFGIIVEVAPLIDEDNNVDTNILVSIIFPAEEIRAVGGVVAPAFEKDEVRTNVILKENETLVLSGLISNRLRRGFNGWPFLGKIPLIRHFFGTKQLSLNKSQLVLFVTPTIITPGSGSADVDNQLKTKLEFDIDVEPKFSIEYRTRNTSQR